MEKTTGNLAKAFAGESQARNRYSFYASVARKEGYEVIGEIFQLTSDQEKEHAKKILELINGINKSESIRVETDVPLKIGTTVENLRSAIAGENYEHSILYPGFIDEAEKEGLTAIADRLRAIKRAEEHHDERFTKLLKALEGNNLFKKGMVVEWCCIECGYVHKGREAPLNCPSCDHPRAFYRLKCEEY
jgi:rubrerythrin